jgi:hypothetical protein
MDPDPDADPAIIVIDLQGTNQKIIKKIICYYFLKEHLHHFSNIKSPKEVTDQ